MREDLVCKIRQPGNRTANCIIAIGRISKARRLNAILYKEDSLLLLPVWHWRQKKLLWKTQKWAGGTGAMLIAVRAAAAAPYFCASRWVVPGTNKKVAWIVLLNRHPGFPAVTFPTATHWGRFEITMTCKLYCNCSFHLPACLPVTGLPLSPLTGTCTHC